MDLGQGNLSLNANQWSPKVCNKKRYGNQIENTKRGSQIQKTKSTSAYKLKDNICYVRMWKKKKFNIWFMNNTLFACSFLNKCKHMEKIGRNNSLGTTIWTHSAIAHLEKPGRTFWFLDQIGQTNKTKTSPCQHSSGMLATVFSATEVLSTKNMQMRKIKTPSGISCQHRCHSMYRIDVPKDTSIICLPYNS